MAQTPIQKELGRIAADYRRYFVLKGLSWCWAGAALFGSVLLLLYWLGGITVPFAFQALIALTIGSVIFVFLRRSRTQVALREIARQVERDDPKLNSLLLAAAEQEPDRETGAFSFLQARVIGEALEANRKSPWRQKFVERLFFAQSRHFALMSCALVVFCALALVLPQRTGAALANAREVQITPGNASLEKGSAVAIVAQLLQPAFSGVNLVYVSPAGGEKKVAMARSLNDPLYGFTLPSVDENTRYYVEYDGTRSADFKLEVFEHPELKRADAELNYPKYTGLAVSRIEDTRRITAIEGTDVGYSFFLNKPVRTARLLGTNDTELALTNRGSNAVLYSLSFPLEESGRFKLELVDEEGRTNKLPSDFVFVALKNEPPKLKLQSPRGDQRISALQEVKFEAETQDDFGVSAFGISYSVPGRKSETIALSEVSLTNQAGTKPHQAQSFSWTLPVETLGAEVGEVVSYYLWAEDLGPDGQVRRSESDIYFAEVRPFEEIFRQGSGGQSSSEQQQGGGQNNPATKLLELQKEIVTATWNLQRRENKEKPGAKFADDVGVVRDSQGSALQQVRDLKDDLRDEKSLAIAEQALTAMSSAEKILAEAADGNAVRVLPAALEAEQKAYQALLKLQAREYQVSRSRSRSSQGNAGNQRAQRQLEQLEFTEDEKRYETESQASPLQSPEQRETLQVLNRLKELARRQQDMSGRLKELQTALNEAKSKQEREELERQLKRLQEEQQQIVQDMDEVRQRMSQPENQSRMAEARQQLDQTRQQSREAARQLENQNLGQALNSSSRAEQELEKLSDDFRKATSQQFSEEMREMRQQARDLEQKQQDIAKKMEEMKETRQRTLGEEGPRKEALDAMAQQRSSLTNLLQNMRQVTEQAETAEPLLSRQLYETLRRSSQANPEKALEISSQLLERNFLPQAAEAHENASQTIRDIKEGIEQAAGNVLGDEAESLRFAQRELQDLADRAERELNQERELSQTGGNSVTNRLAAANADFNLLTNRVGGPAQGNSTNRLANLARNQPDQSPGESGAGERSASENSQEAGEGQPSPNNGQQVASAGEGSRPSFGQGQQPGSGSSQESPSADSEGQGEGQGGQQPGQSVAQSRAGQGQSGSGGENGQGGDQPGQARGGQPGQNGNRSNFFDQWAEGGGNGGGAGGNRFEGPFTGGDYTRWSDRLRDIEEVLQDPALRADVARVREQARSMRSDYKRHAQAPQWDLVEGEVIKPLRILQNRVAEQLARHGSREAVVPVDRDPVPQKYADAVSRYYERLGKE